MGRRSHLPFLEGGVREFDTGVSPDFRSPEVGISVSRYSIGNRIYTTVFYQS